MPPSSDLPSTQQHSAVDPSLLNHQDPSRSRSPARKAQGKKKKRYDSGGENVEKETSSPGPIIRHMTSPSSILSQLHASTSSPVGPSNGITPALLEAWSSPRPPPSLDPQQQQPPPQNVDDWTGADNYGRSPSQAYVNGISMAGSPPQHQPWLDEPRGGFSHPSPPTSPRASYRRPIQRNNGYPSFGTDNLGRSPGSRRSGSRQSERSQYPPPPHQPQAHFYGAPEIDMGYPKVSTDTKAPNNEFCCVFDSLPCASQGTSGGMDVLVIGLARSLVVYGVEKKKVERVGLMEGLRGAVVGAKILPFCASNGAQPPEPLIAVVVHGLYDPPSRGASDLEADEYPLSTHEKQAFTENQKSDPIYYQTTVEVYSLRTAERLAILLRTPKMEAKDNLYDSDDDPPATLGDLRVQANGRFIIVSCGISGEVYIFDYIPEEAEHPALGFRCIGKVWTRISSRSSKHARSMSGSSTESRSGIALDATKSSPTLSEAPIAALSHRWLAVVPPDSSAQATIHAKVVSDVSGNKSPGVTSHTSPAEPHITCELDMPNDGNVVNKVARDLAQGALKGAQYLAIEGMQVWNNYWSKSTESSKQSIAGSPPSSTVSGQWPTQQFPPTHAQESTSNRARNQPINISILDLEKLSQSQRGKASAALQPLATFSLPLGCSLLSFSPNGLNLLTVSAKGDDQHVWDLMRMIHGEVGRASDHGARPEGPSVRQVARFSRVTEARIIDVAWMEPGGERFAITSDKGTVHVYDLPESAFRWPPPGWRQRSATVPSKPNDLYSKGEDTARSESAGGSLSSAFGMLTGKTQPLLAAVRGRSPSTSSGFSGLGRMTAGAGAKGGKAVAAGFNRSVSAAATGTVNTLRHYGENRVALPASSLPIIVEPGRVKWLSGVSRGRLAVTGGGIVRAYNVRASNDPKAGHGRPAIVGSKPTQFELSKLANETAAPPGSFWLQPASTPSQRHTNADTHPLSYAEIDTCNPYQPFHSDRHVSLHIYNDNVDHHLHDSGPWVFGEPIPSSKITVSPSTRDDHPAGINTIAPSQMEKVINIDGNVGEGQQILMTTRRKRAKKGEGDQVGEEEDEIFEDDMEMLEFAEGRV